MYKKKKQYYMVLLSMLLIICSITLASCKKKETTKITEGQNLPNQQVDTGKLVDFIGIVIENQEDYKSFKVLNIANEQPVTLNVDGAVEVYDKYGSVMAISQLKLGMPVNIQCDTETMIPTTIKVSSDMWEIQNNGTLNIDKEQHIIKFGNNKYQYSKSIVVASNNQLLDVAQIFGMDQVTIRGYAGKIFSIIVNSGHGYLKLKNYTYFIGGTLSAKNIYSDIIPNMLLMVPEGRYNLKIEKNSFNAIEPIMVARDEIIEVDMAKYKNDIPKTGSVNFRITPIDSKLFINNFLYDFKELITLQYGTYNIKIVRDDYITETGKLIVSSPLTEYSVELEENTSTSQNTSNNNTNNNNNNTTTGTSVTTNSSVNTGNKVGTSTVKTPKGAQVYLDGVLIGTAPATFQNTAGTHTLTFIKSGYTTKSYSIIIEDVTKEIEYNFEDLVIKQ